MAQAVRWRVVIAMEGAQCVSLGAQTPMADILKAADAHRIDILGLSYIANLHRAAQAPLFALRHRRRREVEILVGGTAALLDPPRSDPIRLVRPLPDTSASVSTVRDRHARA